MGSCQSSRTYSNKDEGKSRRAAGVLNTGISIFEVSLLFISVSYTHDQWYTTPLSFFQHAQPHPQDFTKSPESTEDNEDCNTRVGIASICWDSARAEDRFCLINLQSKTSV